MIPAFGYAGTIDGTSKYARFLDSSLGRINFGTTEGAVTVSDSALTGYAWGEYVGWIHLNPTNGGVTNNGYGVLEGYAWGENTGWINFKPANGGVTIDASGNFNGYAWSEMRGWIVFNCATDSTCGTLDHKVKTDWIPISARSQCNNTLDDDGDGKTDYPADLGCTSAADNDETGPSGGGAITQTPTSSPSPPSETSPSSSPSTLPPPSPPISPPENIPPPPSPPNEGGTIEPSPASGGGGEIPGSGGGQSSPANTSSDGGSIPISTFFISNLPSQINAIVQEAISTFSQTTKEGAIRAVKVVTETRKEVRDVLKTPEGTVTSKTITTTGIVTGGVTSLFSLLVAPFSVSEIFLLPFRLWALLLSALGIKRRHRPWGAVYDSVTKQPLDPAYVVLQTLEGKEVATAITDLDGRYGFLAPPGVYRIVANKTNYKFPSENLKGKGGDEIYHNLYFGDPITVDQGGEILARDIPMDPEGFDWNEYAKRAQRLMGFYSRHTIFIERFSRLMFGVGFLIALIAMAVDFQVYNIAITSLYILVWILHKLGPGERPHGVVLEKETSLPASFSFITVRHEKSTIEARKTVADALGRYYCLVAKGTYTLGVTRRGENGSYIPTEFSKTVRAPRGIIREKLEV